MNARLAEDSDGPRIRQLIAQTQADIEGLDWSEIRPYWIVVDREGEPVGCLNVALSKPVGRLDFLAIDPGLGPHARGRVVRALILQGLSALRRAGCSASISQVPFELKTYKKLLKKHFGAMVVGQGNMVLRVL
ncbi:MAG: hypothetical protein ACR2QC_06965 [Gammaproteobacteria bacterium]